MAKSQKPVSVAELLVLRNEKMPTVFGMIIEI